MEKSSRQQIIRELIARTPIHTQEELVAQLEAAGHSVTQATISRDIRELHLIKVPAVGGSARYALPVQATNATHDALSSTLRASRAIVTVMDRFVNVSVQPGSGPAIGTLIEGLEDGRIFATLSGDAAVVLICRSAKMALSLRDELAEMVE